MTIKTIAIVLSLSSIATPVFAISGQTIGTLGANDPANPYCVTFTQQGDTTHTYGTSLRDPGATESLIILNNARGAIPGPTFIIGDPGLAFNAADCAANGVIYVHTIKR